MTRLVVFDCDGTLVDSQHLIVACMSEAFRVHDLEPPPAAAVRHVVGLSLAHAIGHLLPAADGDACEAIAMSYRQAFRDRRASSTFLEPLFDGARAVLDELDRRGHVIAMATGKSTRGAQAVLEHHGLSHLFASVQTADLHPGKPHPAMLEQAMLETGSEPKDTVLIGDTSYDMVMARAAGVRALGVAWGYHPAPYLRESGAAAILERFEDLLDQLDVVRP